MEAVVSVLQSIYDAVIGFFQDVFTSIKTFFTALLDTIENYYYAFVNYFTNVWESLRLFLIDLPLLVWKKILDMIVWLFQWASDACSMCLGGAANATSTLATSLQYCFDLLVEYAPAIIYCIQRSGVVEGFQIITCGLIVWSTFKIIRIIRG